MFRPLIALIVAITLVVPVGVSAAVFSVEELVSPPDDLGSDLYAVGDRVTISHGIAGDLFAAADTVITYADATIMGDIFAVGNDVQLSGTVTDDVLTAGSDVTIAETTMGDLFAAGNRVTITDQATVTGDAYLAGETVTVSGTIAGNARIAGSTLTITDGARIEGNLRTYGEEPVIAEGAIIEGEHVHTHGAMHSERTTQDKLLAWVMSVVTWFVTTLLVLYLMPNIARRTTTAVLKKPMPLLGIGLLWYFLFIPVVIALFVTVVGIPSALGLLGALITVSVVSFALAALVVGAWLMQSVWKVTTSRYTWQHALLGVVVFQAIGAVPLVGWLIVALIVVATTGAVLKSWWQVTHNVSA